MNESVRGSHDVRNVGRIVLDVQFAPRKNSTEIKLGRSVNVPIFDICGGTTVHFPKNPNDPINFAYSRIRNLYTYFIYLLKSISRAILYAPELLTIR